MLTFSTDKLEDVEKTIKGVKINSEAVDYAVAVRK